MKHITDQITAWLDLSGVHLDPNGFAFHALLTDFDQVCKLNEEVRSFPDEWIAGKWPDDQWIIGEDGAGNCFVMSKSSAYKGVQFFDHEWKRFEPESEGLREFFDSCLQIELSAKKTEQPGSVGRDTAAKS